jgi:ferredoxin
MATYITDECINCGACEPECPNEAISAGEEIFIIDPALCTECVGFHGDEACQDVCPVECCIPDPNIRETEEQLLARAVALHPDQKFPSIEELDETTSRFRNPNWLNTGREDEDI